MKIDYEYLAGYVTALVIALFSTVSVSVFLLKSAPLWVTIISSSACFLLNLLLFWRDFPSIKSGIISQDTPLLAKLLTLCTSLVIYAFSYFSFIELTQTFSVAASLINPALIHVFSLLTAVGFYGLYITDCKDAVNNLKSIWNNPKSIQNTHLLWLIVLSSYLYLPFVFQTPLIILTLTNIYLEHGKQACIENTAGFASIALCILGYGAYLPLLYVQITSPPIRLLAQVILNTGMLSLVINDALYSITQTRKDQKVPNKIGLLSLLVLAVMNAVANSQLAAQGQGFNIFALLSGGMSFLTMKNSLTEIYQDSEKQKPPYNKNGGAFFLFIANTLIAIGGFFFLKSRTPQLAQQVSAFLSKQLLPKVTYGHAVIAGSVGIHTALHAINQEETKIIKTV